MSFKKIVCGYCNKVCVYRFKSLKPKFCNKYCFFKAKHKRATILLQENRKIGYPSFSQFLRDLKEKILNIFR